MESTIHSPSSLSSRLGEFQINKLLGEGGSGTVYAARWGHRQVALKVLRSTLVSSESEQKRFFSEAQILASVDHPAVVKVMGFGKLPDERPYLAMELLEGETMAARLAQGPCPVAQAVELFDQVAQAVHALHGRGLIHRDIKPENIFLVEEGRYAVLLDFGIAKSMDAPDSTVTRDGGVRGTPAYMAPERFFGTAADQRTDVYELALTMYMMLVGRLPWSNPADPMSRLNPIRPSDLDIKIPEALETAILKALSTRPEARPSSVKELQSQVLASVGQSPRPSGRRTADLPVAAGPPSTAMTTSPNAGLGQASTVASSTPQTGPQTGRRASVVTGPIPKSPGLSKWQIAAMSTGLLSLVLGGVLALLFWSWSSSKKRSSRLEKKAQSPTDSLKHRPRPAQVLPLAPILVPLKGGKEIPVDSEAVFRYLPRQTGFILALSHNLLRRSTLYGSLTESFKQPHIGMLVGMIRQVCGFDPLASLEWVSLGIGKENKKTTMTILARGSWSRSALSSCLVQTGSLVDTKIAVKQMGRLSEVSASNAKILVAWPDDHTVLVTLREKPDARWLQNRLKGVASASSNKALKKIFTSIDGKATLWMIATDPSLAQSLLEGIPLPDTMYTTLTAKAGILLVASMVYPSTTQAEKALAATKKKLEQMKKESFVAYFISRAGVTVSGTTVKVEIQLNRSASIVLAKGMIESTQKMWKTMDEPKKDEPPRGHKKSRPKKTEGIKKKEGPAAKTDRTRTKVAPREK